MQLKPIESPSPPEKNYNIKEQTKTKLKRTREKLNKVTLFQLSRCEMLLKVMSLKQIFISYILFNFSLNGDYRLKQKPFKLANKKM